MARKKKEKKEKKAPVKKVHSRDSTRVRA